MNNYFFIFFIYESLLFHTQNLQIVTFSYYKNMNHYFIIWKIYKFLLILIRKVTNHYIFLAYKLWFITFLCCLFPFSSFSVSLKLLKQYHLFFLVSDIANKYVYRTIQLLTHLNTTILLYRISYPFSTLKWQCHKIILAFFLFRESNPPKPLINRLKWFCWKVRFRGDIHEISDSTLTNTARKIKFAEVQKWLTLLGVRQFFCCFRTSPSPGNLGSIC